MRVPDGIDTLECSGSTITAGFWNSHVHFFEAGMTFREILAALTTTPAAIFGGTATTGRIAPDQPADLVVLDGDPSQNVRALADVRYTLRDGAVLYP